MVHKSHLRNPRFPTDSLIIYIKFLNYCLMSVIFDFYITISYVSIGPSSRKINFVFFIFVVLLKNQISLNDESGKCSFVVFPKELLKLLFCLPSFVSFLKNPSLPW